MQTPRFQLMQAWQDASAFSQQEVVDEDLYAALTHTGSLTRFLEERYHRPVDVTVRQQVATPTVQAPLQSLWDTPLQLQAETLLVRDAWVNHAGPMLVYAHSQIGWDHLEKGDRDTIRNGQIPLGGLYLANGAVVNRAHLQISQVQVEGLERIGQAPLWCRRSLFTVNGRPNARILELFAPVVP
ncbi:chorismate--pyruvate lyase family protein [Magnetococcus sp. PR-3]|uniref:chorismate--pyruvate lyase family protein n=1 Tax=Magnetococcus sp. PR-3 TaxID=3120355 RepID=UPI002FCDF28F